jgi:hypothetical protein
MEEEVVAWPVLKEPAALEAIEATGYENRWCEKTVDHEFLLQFVRIPNRTAYRRKFLTGAWNRLIAFKQLRRRSSEESSTLKETACSASEDEKRPCFPGIPDRLHWWSTRSP